MRNPKRIYKVLQLVARAWGAAPDLRLSQLIHAAIEQSEYSGDPFYVEDEALVNGLNAMLEHQRQRVREQKGQPRGAGGTARSE